MKLRYKPHTPRLKIVGHYMRELFRDELQESFNLCVMELNTPYRSLNIM